jgi:hypothetical protein
MNCLGMLTPWSHAEVCNTLAQDYRARHPGEVNPTVRMIGLLFVQSRLRIAREEIVPNLAYFHHTSGATIDFFCAGYGRYWYPPPEDQEEVTADHPPWLFSLTLFGKFREEIEKLCTWQYSGEADLLLMNAHINPEDDVARLDFRSAVVCDLEKMKHDEAIRTVPRFFEDIFKYAEKAPANDPTWGFSDNMGLHIGGNAIKRVVLSLLPRKLDDDYRRAEHFAVRDINAKT